MAEAQVAGSNGAAKAPPPPSVEADGGDTDAPDLVDMLTGAAELPEGVGPGDDDDTDADEGTVEDGEPAGDEEQESDPAAAAAKDVADDEAANKVAEDAAFSEAALKKADGIKKAREIVLAARQAAEQRQKRLDRFDRRLHKREQNWNATREAEQAKIDEDKGLGRHVHHLLGLMQNGTAADRIAALAALTGRPGVEVVEELNAGILSDGKKPPASREVQELRGYVSRLEAKLEQERQQEQQAVAKAERDHKVGRVEEHKQQAAELGSDAEKYPAVAAEIEKWGEQMSDQVGAWVVKYITDHHRKTGERLDKPAVLGILNARLAKKSSEPRKGSSVRDPAKSPVAQRRSAGRGVTVTPDLADRSTGSSRELSRDERLDELSRDRDALKELGLGAFIE